MTIAGFSRPCRRLAAPVPGTAPDSLGVYLTWQPRIGRLDGERNCISNIRPPAGLSYEQAAIRLAWLMNTARRLRLSGIALKEESGPLTLRNM